MSAIEIPISNILAGLIIFFLVRTIIKRVLEISAENNDNNRNDFDYRKIAIVE